MDVAEHATVTVNALPNITGTLNVCTGSTTQLTGSGTPAVSSPGFLQLQVSLP